MQGSLNPFRPVNASVWLRDESSSVFHLPITSASWPGAYNTPDNPIDLARAHEHVTHGGNLLNIILPEGRITIDFTIKGRAGDCTRCGQCCVDCKWLVQHGRGIGFKNGTTCAIYRKRLRSGYKGCVLFPERRLDIVRYPACTMTFPARKP